MCWVADTEPSLVGLLLLILQKMGTWIRSSRAMWTERITWNRISLSSFHLTDTWSLLLSYYCQVGLDQERVDLQPEGWYFTPCLLPADCRGIPERDTQHTVESTTPCIVDSAVNVCVYVCVILTLLWIVMSLWIKEFAKCPTRMLTNQIKKLDKKHIDVFFMDYYILYCFH